MNNFLHSFKHAKAVVGMMLALCLLSACQMNKEEQSQEVLNEIAQTCTDLQMSSTSGQPLDQVQLSVVPAAFGEHVALLTKSITTESTILTPVERAETGAGASFHVPVHPDMLSGGGEVLMILLDTEGNSCEPVSFTIQALPTSPGAYEQLAQLIIQMGEEQARIVGIDTSLANAFLEGGDHPFTAIHQAMGELLKGEDNPNSVLRIAANESPAIGELSTEHWQVLDGLVEQSGILTALSAYTEHLKEVEELRLDDQTSAQASKQDGLVRISSMGGNQPWLCRGPLYKPDAARLSEMMDLQIKGEIYSTDTGLLDASELLFGVSGVLATAAGGPKTAEVAGAMGSIITGMKTQWSAYEGIYPNQLIDLTIEVMPDYFLEDSENLEGSWDKAMLTAQSKGWNADKEVFNFLLSKLGGKLTKNAAGKAKIQAGDNLEAIMEIEYVESAVNLMWDLLGNALTNELYGAEPGKGGIFEFPSCTFGPTDISGEEWSESHIIHEDKAPVFMLDHHTYQARATGEAILEVKPHGKKFGRRYLGPDGTFLNAEEIITVLPIEVEVHPSEYTVEPGEVVVFKAVVYNAYDRGVVWEVSPAGAHEVHVSTEADRTSVLTIFTSKNETEFPVTVTATSTASKGLRALLDAPPRQGHGLIRSDKLEVDIVPQTCCVEPGASETFTAIVRNSDNQNVVWSVSEGSITADGLFTAPSTAGNVMITATSVADPSVSGEALVRVGDCICFNGITIGGLTRLGESTYITRTGDKLDGPLQSMTFIFDADAVDSSDSVSIDFIGEGPRPGQTGSYKVEVAGAMFDAALSDFVAREHMMEIFGDKVPWEVLRDGQIIRLDVPSYATLTIEEFEEGPEAHMALIRGNLQGEVLVLQHGTEEPYYENPERLPISLTFSGYYNKVLNQSMINCYGTSW